jgi:hypothetical protein
MARSGKKAVVQLAVVLMVAGWANAQNTTPAQQATTAKPATTAANPPAATNTPATQANTSKTTANTNSVTTTAGTAVITGVPTGGSATTDPGSFSIGDVPTIAGYGIPTMMVPWTAGAPFMAKSDLPEGTVFIAVGALLGAMGAAVLLWRGLVAWSLHRSVKKANEKLIMGNTGKLQKGGYTQSSLALGNSNMSLDHLAAPPRKLTRSSIAPSLAARNSSLFFSPTAGAGLQTSGTYSSINRSSGMLPSGFYAAPGAAVPGTAYVGGNGARSSIYGGGRASQYNGSPPSSPGLPPSRGGMSNHGHSHMYNQPSTSTLNLNIPGGHSQPGMRAPSANLDDLFGNDPSSARR